jgi:formate dehydrogenase major subunit
MTNSFAEFAKAKMIFVIGSNMTEAHPVAASFVKQAVLAGAPLFVADPRRTALADMAEPHPHPGGKRVAFINGLMNVLIAENLYDRYVSPAATGSRSSTKVLEYPPERAAEISG